LNSTVENTPLVESETSKFLAVPSYHVSKYAYYVGYISYHVNALEYSTNGEGELMDDVLRKKVGSTILG